MVAVAGAALFLTQLGQMLQMLGLSSALQFVIDGVAIALGMAVSNESIHRGQGSICRASASFAAQAFRRWRLWQS